MEKKIEIIKDDYGTYTAFVDDVDAGYFYVSVEEFDDFYTSTTHACVTTMNIKNNFQKMGVGKKILETILSDYPHVTFPDWVKADRNQEDFLTDEGYSFVCRMESHGLIKYSNQEDDDIY